MRYFFQLTFHRLINAMTWFPLRYLKLMFRDAREPLPVDLTGYLSCDWFWGHAARLLTIVTSVVVVAQPSKRDGSCFQASLCRQCNVAMVGLREFIDESQSVNNTYGCVCAQGDVLMLLDQGFLFVRVPFSCHHLFLCLSVLGTNCRFAQ